MSTINYGTVRGRYLATTRDSTNPDDPDLTPMSGTVTLTAQVGALLTEDATQLPAPIVCYLDADGDLTFTDEEGLTTKSVRVVATDTLTNPSDFTYRVSHNLTHEKKHVPYASFNIQVPSNSVIDLATVAPVPASTGEPVVRGASAYEIALLEGYQGTREQWLTTLEGPQGPKGDQGPQGEQGIPGTAVEKGWSAYEVAVNVDGFSGTEQEWLASLEGEDGTQGPEGPRGPQGETGPQGPQGDRGPQGIKGDQGLMGPRGYMGFVGPEGPRGPQGIQGEVGPQGPRGFQGPIGETGPQGIRAGSKWWMSTLDGSRENLYDSAVIGDFYLEESSGDVYELISATVWQFAGNLKGIQGDTGPKGEKGDQGPRGETGLGSTWFNSAEDGPYHTLDFNGIPVEGDYWIDTETGDVRQYLYASTDGLGNISYNFEYIGNIQGAQGPKGDQGIQGIQGPRGIAGATWYDSNEIWIDDITTQNDGDYWLDMSSGFMFRWDADVNGGQWTNTGNLRGEGNRWFNSVTDGGVYSLTIMKVGDYWIDMSTGNVLRYTVDEVWANVGNLKGLKGDTGPAGESAYEEAVSLGFVGTEAEWVASLEGDQGPVGPEGPAGPEGPQGDQGPRGVTWFNNLDYATPEDVPNPMHGDMWWDRNLNGQVQRYDGPTATWNVWTYLEGPKGDTGEQGPVGETGPIGPEGPAGPEGDDAYEVAVASGFVGTREEWLASLVGPEGPTGPEGPKGDKGDTGLTGADGDSAYEIAVAGGFVGTESEWIASLEGPQGPAGEDGLGVNGGAVFIQETAPANPVPGTVWIW